MRGWELSPHFWRWFICKHRGRWRVFRRSENFLFLNLLLKKTRFHLLLATNVLSSQELTFTFVPWFPPCPAVDKCQRNWKTSLTFSLSCRNDLVRMQGNLGGGAAGVRAAPVEPAGLRDAVHLRGLLHRQVHGLPESQRGPGVCGPARAGRLASQRLTSTGSGLLHLRWAGGRCSARNKPHAPGAWPRALHASPPADPPLKQPCCSLPHSQLNRTRN